MKLTTLLLIIALMQASAKTYSQISVSVKNQPVTKVLEYIKQQTGYVFLYEDDLLNDKNVSLHLSNVSIQTALTECFKDLPLTFKIIQKNVVIQKIEPSLTDKIASTLNLMVVIEAKVVDDKGVPLPGVTVRIKNSNAAAITDNKGAFMMEVPNANTILVISYIGFESQELAANNIPRHSTIALKPTTTNLNEVVVNKGYYSTTQELNTGNVSVVSAKEIAQQPIGNPLAAVEGRVPGLYISQNSGLPGSTFTVHLRGQNSIANGNDPLYIVDGMPYPSSSLSSPDLYDGAVRYQSPFNSLNPQDIESIEVLKDADATAIYGSRGANGVILITTKKGKAGRTTIDANVYSGAGEVTRKLDLMNTAQFNEMRREAFANDGASPSPYDYDLNGGWDNKRYTDWQKVFIGGTARVTDASLNISGGTDLTQFTLGGDFRNETTVFPGNFFDRKISFHTGLNHTSPNKKFKIAFTASYVNDDNLMPETDLTSAIILPPNAPSVFNADGGLNFQNNSFYNNPYAYVLQHNKSVTDNLIANAAVSYEIVPGLTVRASGGYNNIRLSQNNTVPFASLDPTIYTVGQISNAFSNSTLNSWIFEPQLSYHKTMGKGILDAIVGGTFQNSVQEDLTQRAVGFASDALIDNIAAASNIYVSSDPYNQYRYNAFYGRAGYTWDQKYVLNLTGRRDGSSRFGPGKQFGNFGSAGAGWIFSKEAFIKDALPILSFGKLRASYGTTGNDQFANYQYLSTYSSYPYGYQGLSNLQPTQLSNTDYHWEVVKKLEFGLDLGFLNDRITFNASWYRNRTDDQLVGYPLPSISGFTSVEYNLPALVDNKGLELTLNTMNVRHKDFKWTSGLNITFPTNKLVSYPDIQGSAYQYTYAVGQSLFGQYLYHSNGVDPATGIYVFKDVNNDKRLDYANDRIFNFIGQKYFGGIQNDLSYKQLQLSFFVQYVHQTGMKYLYNGLPGTLYSGNQPVAALNRWQKPGDITVTEKYTQTFNNAASAYYTFIQSDGLLGDASFLRLKNVALSWQAPRLWTDALHIQNVRFYVQCQNLLTITKYQGLDPENAGGLVLPPLRMVTGGIQLTL